MNREIFENPQLIADATTTPLAPRLEQLKLKLQGFAVVDSAGRFMGEVSDLVLNEQQQLQLVISQPDVNQGQRFFLIPSRVVSWVRSRSRTLSVTITQADIRHHPDYQPSMQSSNELSFDPIEPDSQTHDLDLTSLEGLENQPTTAVREEESTAQVNPPKVSGAVVQEETIRLLEE
ncbi:MAG: PRC-barrel domain-containing protein, partial [Phormidesmis sp. CAN_BIN36]|nr:PRC-barrel domain-containing protein [Phormidesmis sp. CAN_BIN36]